MVFAEGGGIRSEMLMDQPHGVVVAAPGARESWRKASNSA